MARKIKSPIYSEKGAVKPAVRQAIVGDASKSLNDVLIDLGYVYNPDKKAFDLKYCDETGATVYVCLSMSVGKASFEKANKKPSTSTSKVAEVIEIED